jgi:hypothetical protein
MDTCCDPRDRHGQGEYANAIQISAGSACPERRRILLLTDPAMATAHRALPILLRICGAIDRLFVVEVGPFGTQLAEDARIAWLATGNKNRPVDVEQYVALLAQHIDEHDRRDAFVAEACNCIRV